MTALYLFLWIWFGCSNSWSAKAVPGKVVPTIIEISDSGKLIRIPFSWPVWILAQADIDRDGCLELVLGVVKQNHFDPTARRRLQVWRLDRGHLRPVWLGTRLAGILDTFAVDSNGRIVAREQVGPLWQIARWRWKTFGFQSDSLFVRDKRRPPFPKLSQRTR